MKCGRRWLSHARARPGLAPHRLRTHRLERRGCRLRRERCMNISGESFPARLREIFGGVRRADCPSMQPAEVAVERVFVNRNVDSALKLGQARGAALCGHSADGAGVRILAARDQAGGGGHRRRGEDPGCAHGASCCGPGSDSARMLPMRSRWRSAMPTAAGGAAAALLRRSSER